MKRLPRNISHITVESVLHQLMDDATARNLSVLKGLTLASFYLISFGRRQIENQGRARAAKSFAAMRKRKQNDK